MCTYQLFRKWVSSIRFGLHPTVLKRLNLCFLVEVWWAILFTYKMNTVEGQMSQFSTRTWMQLTFGICVKICLKTRRGPATQCQAHWDQLISAPSHIISCTEGYQLTHKVSSWWISKERTISRILETVMTNCLHRLQSIITTTLLWLLVWISILYYLFTFAQKFEPNPQPKHEMLRIKTQP